MKKVSLMYNDILKIPRGFFPKCYSFNFNINAKCVFKGDFFLAISELEVLDLFKTAIKFLTDSIANLKNLTALRLKRCYLLEYVPSLSKLGRLKKLDLNYFGIRLVPLGMEMLISLEYLDLFGTKVTELPISIVSNLTQIQYLVLNCTLPETKMSRIKGVVVAELSKLETLKAHFYDLQNLNYFVKSRESQGLKYALAVCGANRPIPSDFLLSISSDRLVFLLFQIWKRRNIISKHASESGNSQV